MAKMHEFWSLPKGECPEMEKLIDERTKIWGTLPLQQERIVEEMDLTFFLEDYCGFNQRVATRVSQRIMLESFMSFCHVRTLRRGFLPCWGLPLEDYAVIPAPHLAEFQQALLTLPPYASWQRLYELCRKSAEKGQHILYHGITE